MTELGRGANRTVGSMHMKASNLVAPLRWIGRLVLLLMAMAAVYAAYIAISYWPSIAV